MTSSKVKDSFLTLSLTGGTINNAVKTYSMSKRYISMIVKASMTNIMANRLEIAEHSFIFREKSFGDVPYLDIARNSKHPLLSIWTIAWNGFKEAFEKEYVKAFYMFFVDEKTREIMEHYKFEVKYNDKKAKPSKRAEDLTEATAEFLTNLHTLKGYKRMSGISVKFELAYNDDVSASFKPQYFENVGSDSLTAKVSNESSCVELALLNTGFHRLKCKGKGGIFEMDDNVISQKEATQTDKEVLQIDDIITEDFDVVEDNNIQKNAVVDLLSETETNHGNETYIDADDDESLRMMDDIVHCNCKIVQVEIPIDMITCVKCQQEFHAACQGFLNKSFLTEDFVCFYCRVPNFNHDEEEELCSSLSACRMRLLLACIYNLKHIPGSLMADFSSTMKGLEKLFAISGGHTKNHMVVFHRMFRLNGNVVDLEPLRAYFAAYSAENESQLQV